MSESSDAATPTVATRRSVHPRLVRSILQIEWGLLFSSLIAVVLKYGVRPEQEIGRRSLSVLVIIAMAVLTLALLQRFAWSLERPSFLRRERVNLALAGIWLLGTLAELTVLPILNVGITDHWDILGSIAVWSEVILVIRAVFAFLVAIKGIAGRGFNPALVLVGSFVVLITVGTLLLMLPRSRVPDADLLEPDRSVALTAFFTATSASCVTGLVVVPTADYWSPFGHTIILILFQLGGLGIMTCGAFFSLVAGGAFGVRESATFRELFDSDTLATVRRITLTVLIFTFVSEAIGAVLISGLFADLPLGQQVFHSVFHSVSAFCNAGFSLTDNSFVGMETRWQVWGPISWLIIAGGLGFVVVYNLSRLAGSEYHRRFRVRRFDEPTERVRLSLTTKLVLITTALLLITGAIGYFVLETLTGSDEVPFARRSANAWFQSVTFRTAGFNTVDHGAMQVPTKLMAITLMFIGAAPGSTGGGVKTICFAVAVLALLSILRGRKSVEIFGRTLPEQIIYKALAIISLGLFCAMTTTILLTIFENRPDRFLDLLFEAVSAFGTVGVSTGITPELTVPSQFVIIVAMFFGRVGPLTLMLALPRIRSRGQYTYPEERVLLG